MGVGFVGAALVGWAVLASGAWVNLAVALVLIGFGCATIMVARAGPALTLSAGLALTLFSGHWSDMGLPIPLDRLVVVIGLGATLLRADMRRELLTRLRQPLSILLGVVAVYAIVSAWQAETLKSADGSFALLDSLGLIPFAFYVVAPVVFRTEHDRNILLTTLVGLGAYLGLTAVFETVGPSALVLPSYINDPSIGIHFGRARGPFTEASANGLALYACAVAAAVALHRWRGQRRAIFAAIVIVLCSMGVLFTLTRAIWVGAVLGTLVTLLWFKPLRRLFIPTAAAATLVAIGSLVVIPGFASEAQKRQSDLSPVWDRLNTDAAALRMIKARPLEGFGWSTFAATGPRYMRQADSYPLTGAGLDVHNVFLARFAELGLLGGTLWLIALALMLYYGAIRAGPPDLLPWRIGFVAIAIDWLVLANFVPLTFAFPNALLWLWAGVVTPTPNEEADAPPAS